MIIDITINTSREGILTMKENELTLITDQIIAEGDILHSPLHKQKDNSPVDIVVEEVVEERRSRGTWKEEPPIWRKIKYHKVYAA